MSNYAYSGFGSVTLELPNYFEILFLSDNMSASDDGFDGFSLSWDWLCTNPSYMGVDYQTDHSGIIEFSDNAHR